MLPATPNKALQSAYRKGWSAGYDGKPATDNPYPDLRTYRNGVTFSRAFLRYWRKGWGDGVETKKEMKP